MNVLILGSGGREHALAWKISQSTRADRVFVATGNAGTAMDAENVDISSTDIPRILQFVKQNNIGLTIVGPEAPLAMGIVDAFEKEGQRVFGPSKAAAELEASKIFCKKILRNADIPTADYWTFPNAESARTFINDREDKPVVVKADGLAGGKGVFVCDGSQQALAAVEEIAVERAFGDAGNHLIIEERLVGDEASVLALVDGRTIYPLPSAQDHKPALDGDKGPNTGGMGAYSPTPLVTDEILQSVYEQVLVPTVHHMKRSRRPFRGILYAGLIMTSQGPKVLEYNVRFGDPECQPIMMRLQSDLLDMLEATVDGKLSEIDTPKWDPRPAVCVVMASEGYPGSYEINKPIRGLNEAFKLDDVKVFHAGTTSAGGQVMTSGGRVLGVTALGDTISKAKREAYRGVKCIRWDGAWCRKDISDKALGY